MYIFGGVDGDKRFNDMWKLDTGCLETHDSLLKLHSHNPSDANKWEKVSVSNEQATPSARHGATLTWMGDSSFLLFGGYDGMNFLDDMHIFNTGTKIRSSFA